MRLTNVPRGPPPRRTVSLANLCFCGVPFPDDTSSSWVVSPNFLTSFRLAPPQPAKHFQYMYPTLRPASFHYPLSRLRDSFRRGSCQFSKARVICHAGCNISLRLSDFSQVLCEHIGLPDVLSRLVCRRRGGLNSFSRILFPGFLGFKALRNLKRDFIFRQDKFIFPRLRSLRSRLARNPLELTATSVRFV